MGRTLSYFEAIEKIKQTCCLPMFDENDWYGHRKDGKIIRYLFKDQLGHMFSAPYYSVISGKQLQCPECGKQLQLGKQKLTRKEYEDYIDKFKEEKRILLLTKYDFYKNIRQKLEFKCLLCGLIFSESIENIIKKSTFGHGCVRISSGERIAIEFFENKGIKYNFQVYISDLSLISDFEIELDNGTKIHLEIDGDQHYVYPNGFHKNYQEFTNAQIRDKKKDIWYSERGCTNIHVRYNAGGKHNDDILKILNDILQNRYGKVRFVDKNLEFTFKDILCLNPQNRKVIAYDLNGNLCGVYETLLEAESILGVDDATISECINGKRNMRRAGQYMFRAYTENYPTKITPYKRSASKEIEIYYLNKLIETVESIQATSRKYQVAASALCRYLKGNGYNPSKTGYDFKYKQ